MSRNRTKTELFVEILNKIRTDKVRYRAELSRETLTDFPLFNRIVQSMVDSGLIKSAYVFDSQSSRQREQLEIMPAANNETLVIKALAKLLAPNLNEVFDEWVDRKRGIAASASAEQLEKSAKMTKTFNLFRRLFKSEESKE